jgi:hypothetical protein
VNRHKPQLLGLDVALEKTGIAQPNGTTFTSVGGTGDARLDRLYWDVYRRAAYADLAVVEDLPTHAMSAGLTGRAHGVVRLALWRHEVPLVTLAPATLKKFATGHGNADKADMAGALSELHADGEFLVKGDRHYLTWPTGRVELTDDNQVDAWWLQFAGECWFAAQAGRVIFRRQHELFRVNKKRRGKKMVEAPVIDWSPFEKWSRR